MKISDGKKALYIALILIGVILLVSTHQYLNGDLNIFGVIAYSIIFPLIILSWFIAWARIKTMRIKYKLGTWFIIIILLLFGASVFLLFSLPEVPLNGITLAQGIAGSILFGLFIIPVTLTEDLILNVNAAIKFFRDK